MTPTCGRCGRPLLSIEDFGYPRYCRPCQHELVAIYSKQLEDAKQTPTEQTTKE